jgi:hypothetical protein
MENPLVLLHTVGNKHIHGSGRDTKGSRTPRKFLVARATP